jgi:hypothetical protein
VLDRERFRVAMISGSKTVILPCLHTVSAPLDGPRHVRTRSCSHLGVSMNMVY